MLAAATPAPAADLGDDREADRIGPSHHKRIYLRGDVGFAWNGATDVYEHDRRLAESSVGRDVSYGVGAGWYISPKWRADITLEQRSDLRVLGSLPLSVVPGDPLGGPRRFDVSSTVAMLNVYYDFTSRDDFNPYLGVGLGFAANRGHGGGAEQFCSGLCSPSYEAATQTNVAWSVMAGLTQPVIPGLVMDAGYRMTNLGGARTGNLTCCDGATVVPNTDHSTSDIYSHEFHLGLRYDVY
jgi:opacity protein-like surface antigen